MDALTMRVVSIGLDSRVGRPDDGSHAVRWTREMASQVEDYVAIAQSASGHDEGPIPLADNAHVWRVAGSKIAYLFRAARLAAHLHAKHHFDVITTEDPIRAGLAGLLVAKRTGIPLNVENHSFHINERIWLQEKRYHHVYNRIAIAVCRGANSIRNYSDGQKAALMAIGVPESRMRTIPIAIPNISIMEEEVARSQIGLTGPFVLCAGRMVAYKNVQFLIDAFLAAGGVRDAKLVLIGDGPAKSDWERSSAAQALGDRLIWREAVPFESMAAYYSAASVFAAPAVHETGPRTVLEALECNCPVVVTPEMGVVRAGICVDGVSALVVRPDDRQGWARAMESLVNDRASALRMATEGKARMGPEFSFPATAGRMVKLLQDTASGAL